MKFARFPLLSFLLLSLLASPLALAGPKIDHWRAPSGARVFFVESHALPILDVEVDFSAGKSRDPEGKSGLASLTHTLLELGVQGMDETEVANRLADLGAVLSGSVDLDRASVGLRTLSAPDKRDAAVDILRQVLNAPLFPASVMEREKARTVASLKDALTRPDVIASRAFWTAMYPEHPYGRHATPESIDALERADLLGFYRRHYSANQATVAIVGDISRGQAEDLAQRLTAGLPVNETLPALLEPARPVASERQIAHPAAQAHLAIGLPALKRGDPDFFPLLVGNYTLGGGGFVSRLMTEVRENRGYAYSVYSYFSPLAQLGPFQIGLQTKKAQAGEALELTRRVLNDFLAQGPSAEELSAARQNLAGSFPLRLDSNRKILDNVAVIGFYGLPPDYLDRYEERIRAVSAADVKAAFARHVKPENMVTVVVGGQ